MPAGRQGRVSFQALPSARQVGELALNRSAASLQCCQAQLGRGFDPLVKFPGPAPIRHLYQEDFAARRNPGVDVRDAALHAAIVMKGPKTKSEGKYSILAFFKAERSSASPRDAFRDQFLPRDFHSSSGLV